jgi:hypothetical protein
MLQAKYTVEVKTLCGALLALGMATGMLAQEPAAPSGKFYGPLIPKPGTPKSFRFDNQPGVLRPTVIPQQPAVSRCAVPLIEMQTPKAGDPAMQFGPHMEKVAPMPQAKLPPACDAPSSGGAAPR